MILNIPEAIHMPHEFFQTEILDSIFNRFLFITIKMNSEVRCPTIKIKRQQCYLLSSLLSLLFVKQDRRLSVLKLVRLHVVIIN